MYGNDPLEQKQLYYGNSQTVISMDDSKLFISMRRCELTCSLQLCGFNNVIEIVE